MSQLLAIAALIVEPRWLKPGWQLLGHRVTWYLVGLALLLTVASGIDYFVKARSRLRGLPPVVMEDYPAPGAPEGIGGRGRNTQADAEKE